MKTIAPLLFILILAACTSQPETTAAGEPTNVSASVNEQIARQMFEHFNRHEWDKMAALYIDSAEFKDPSFGIEIVKQSRQQIAQKYLEMNQLFPDIHDEILAVYPSGNKNIIVEFMSSGTAPDNSKFKLPIVTIFTIEDGMITKDFTYYDNF